MQNGSGTTYWRSCGRTALAAIEKGSFDPNTNALRLEGNAPSLDREGESHYVIEVNEEALSGTYDCGGLRGNFTFTRCAARKG